MYVGSITQDHSIEQVNTCDSYEPDLPQHVRLIALYPIKQNTAAPALKFSASSLFLQNLEYFFFKEISKILNT